MARKVIIAKHQQPSGPTKPALVPAPPPRPEVPEEYERNTYTLKRTHLVALKQAALDRCARVGGKADASAVLRDLLDKWIRERTE